MSLTTGRTKLLEAYKMLMVRWEETKDGWDDHSGKEFEKTTMEPLGPHVQATLRAIDRLSAVLVQMQHEID